MADSTMIRVNKSTKERIIKYGNKYGQSIDDILNLILDELDKKVSKADDKAFNQLADAALSAARKKGKK
jgi:replication initiation and membrane attachment protein DnaB